MKYHGVTLHRKLENNIGLLIFWHPVYFIHRRSGTGASQHLSGIIEDSHREQPSV